MSSNHNPALIRGLPAVDDRRKSWVGFWQLTPYVDKRKRVHYIYDRKDADSSKVECHLGDGPAVITDGYGGWSQVTRPRNKALTQWDGVNGFTMQVPVIISGWFHNSSVESRVRRLEQMGRAGEGEDEPPVIACTLPGDSPRDGESFLWVVESIEWGNSRRRWKDGHRTYQEGTVTLWEYVRPDIVALSPARKRKAKTKLPKNYEKWSKDRKHAYWAAKRKARGK